MEVAKNMDTIFADCSEEDLEFDVFFDQEDDLIDTVIGVKENGDPLTGVDFEQLHQDAEDVDQKDIKDELGPDSEEYDMGSKEAEGTEEKKLDIDQELDSLEKNGESDADKELGLDKLDDEYQDGKADGKAPDADNVTDVVEDEIAEAAKIAEALARHGYKIVKEETCPNCGKDVPEGETCCDVDDELDPVSAPSDDGSGEEQPVSGEIPSDNGDAVKECGDDVQSMIDKMEALGYTVSKKEEPAPEVEEPVADEAPAAEEPTVDAPADECGGNCNAADDVAMDAEVEVDEAPVEDEDIVAKDLVDSLVKMGYKIVKVEEEEPVVEEPVADEAPEVPTEEGCCKEEAEVPVEGSDEKPSDIKDDDNSDLAPEGDEEYNATDDASVKEDAEKLAKSLAKLGYKLVKEEVEDAEIIDSEDDLAPEGDEEYNATDDASVKEDADIDSILDTEEEEVLDDEALDEVEDDGTANSDLEYDISDEELIDIALKN